MLKCTDIVFDQLLNYNYYDVSHLKKKLFKRHNYDRNK